jgi:hypothetical protein
MALYASRKNPFIHVCVCGRERWNPSIVVKKYCVFSREKSPMQLVINVSQQYRMNPLILPTLFSLLL